MASAFYFWSSSFNNKEEEVPLPSDIHERKPEPVRQSKGKKGNKSGYQQPTKKQPQRGLGVAQLERLRQEERWKKMTQLHELHAGSDATDFPLPLQFFNPRNPNSLSTSRPVPPSCYGGFTESSISRSALGGHSDPMAAAGSLIPNPSQNPKNTVVNIEGDFSSTQNMKGFSNSWELYVNKKRQHEDVMRLQNDSNSYSGGGESSGLGVDSGRDFANPRSGGGGGRPGDQESKGFGGGECMSAPSCFGMHVPLVRISRSEPMEYEFFPQKFNDGSIMESSSIVHEPTIYEASSSATASAANLIDLSLKLSCY